MRNVLSVAVALTLLLLSHAALAAGGAKVALEHVDINLKDKASLQRGAKYFANYCMGCHSVKFSRYNRVANDIGLTDDQMLDNLIFTRGEDGEQSKVGDLMKNALDPKTAEQWFGAAPPDLSLTARVRSADWIYSFLKGFYADNSRPFGVNNTILENAGMPHVLQGLQGVQVKAHHDDDQHHKDSSAFELVKPGKFTALEYSSVVRDITQFLVYVSEPAQLHRKTIGFYVLLFIAVFFVLALMLKKAFWRDIH